MSKAEEIVARARGAIGVRFRPQGRDVRQGLDCIGLAMLAFAVPEAQVPDDYRLNGEGHGTALRRGLLRAFRRIGRPSRRAGDLLLLQPARGHWHLAVLTDEGFVHADARRRAVIETPGAPEWPIAGVYRRRVRAQSKGN